MNKTTLVTIFVLFIFSCAHAMDNNPSQQRVAAMLPREHRFPLVTEINPAIIARWRVRMANKEIKNSPAQKK